MTRHDELVEQIFSSDNPREMVDLLRLRSATDAELLAALTEAAAWSEDLADEYESEGGEDDELVNAFRDHAALCRKAAAALLRQRRGGGAAADVVSRRGPAAAGR